LNLRDLFPITKESIYFNHASTGPMSIPARKAIEECLNVYSSQAEFDFRTYFFRLAKARLNVAKLIGADPEEIVFTHNTSEGIYIALINLPLKQGDIIIVMEEVFPTVRYIVDYNVPYLEKKYVRFCSKDPIDVIKDNLDKKIKAVVIDWVQFFTGEVIDLKRLGKFLKEREIYLIVDGIQGIGAINFDVKEIEIDFLACGAAKWLFGPSGTGFLYVNKKNFKSLKRLHTGWLGVDWRSFEDFEVNPPLFEDARMFEQGTRNVIGISALSENVKILLQIGLENVENQILGLHEGLRQGLKDMNYEILTPDRLTRSGIITARPKNAGDLYNLLRAKKIIISLRNNALRFSPHFYNTEKEIEKMFNVLRQMPTA